MVWVQSTFHAVRELACWVNEPCVLYVLVGSGDTPPGRAGQGVRDASGRRAGGRDHGAAVGVGQAGPGPRGGRRPGQGPVDRVHDRDDGDGEPAPQGVAAPSAGRPGLALRADRIPVRVHRGADERGAGHQPGPAHRAGPLRAPDEPARHRAAPRGARPGPAFWDPASRDTGSWSTAPRAGAAGRGRRAMTVAVALLAYAACAGTAGAQLLARARWAVRAPLLATVTYLAAAWSVVAAAGLAG